MEQRGQSTVEYALVLLTLGLVVIWGKQVLLGQLETYYRGLIVGSQLPIL